MIAVFTFSPEDIAALLSKGDTDYLGVLKNFGQLTTTRGEGEYWNLRGINQTTALEHKPENNESKQLCQNEM